MIAASISTLLILALSTEGTYPCADSSLYETEGNFWAQTSFGGWEEASRDECDPEESLLFSGSSKESSPAQMSRSNRSSNRASYSLAQGSGGAVHSTVRQQAEQEGWNHWVEVRNDTLTRRSLGWAGNGWRWMAGDLEDPELPIWPVGLPRRTLPRRWQRAARQGDAGYGLSVPRPQGIAAGVIQPHWKAWAARTWNPVETGDEPPWSPAWNLRHASTGISISLPWTVAAQFTETRISRDAMDSMAEQLGAMSVGSPDEDFLLVGAVLKNRGREKSGWALATAWHHRFDNSATMDFTARQRDDAWASSWDPAVTESNNEVDADAALDEGGTDPGWGAGEFRLAAQLPWDQTTLGAETWRAWNPAAGTAREGVRGQLDGRAEEVRFKLTGTHRRARAASGSISVYRYVEAETRLEENPGFRLAAFRAWNGDGPTRTGIFVGVEPSFTKNGKNLRANSGLRIETDAEDRLTARGSLGAHWDFARGWNLDAAAAAPCYPRWIAEDVRWRMTVNYSVRVQARHPRRHSREGGKGGDPDNDE